MEATESNDSLYTFQQKTNDVDANPRAARAFVSRLARDDEMAYDWLVKGEVGTSSPRERFIAIVAMARQDQGFDEEYSEVELHHDILSEGIDLFSLIPVLAIRYIMYLLDNPDMLEFYRRIDDFKLKAFSLHVKRNGIKPCQAGLIVVG